MSGLNFLKVPLLRDDSEHVYHQYVILSEKRDLIKKELEEKQIFCGLHYPQPVHHQHIFSKSDYNLVSLEETDSLAKKILSLPMYPELSIDNAIEVTRCIKSLKL